jgi:predicted transglutaminase-like cysteine proteinase
MLTPEQLAELRSVNREVNKFKYTFDHTRYGKEEYWNLIDKDGGDCEDYALEKRRRLMALGWDVKDLRLTICQTETGEYHCVLTVDDGPDVRVLDNRYATVKTVGGLDYAWIARQKGKDWVRVNTEKHGGA